MSATRAPTLDPRGAAAVLEQLLVRRRAYVPELEPRPQQPAHALLQIFARYMSVVIERLNQAPDKNRLAFLDMMGVSLIPARPSRAPVVFKPRANARDARVEARTRLGAPVAGAPEPIPFETESGIAVAAATLREVVSLWPARDQFVDHSLELAAGRVFQLFAHGQPVQHELYLAHDTLLAFAGDAVVEVEFELTTPGSRPLATIWEAWDGQAWRSFHAFDRTDPTASRDGTAGLTSSGVVRLRAECGDSVRSTVDGMNAYWIRARLDEPLPPDPARVLATVDRIRLRTAIDRPPGRAAGGDDCTTDLRPDAAFGDGSQLDLTKTFFPFGKSPDPDSVFYLSSEEVFSKPGATVTLCFTQVLTPEQQGDERGKDYEVQVDLARKLLKDAATAAAKAILDDARALLDLAQTSFDTTPLNDKIKALEDELAAFTGLTDGPQLAAAAADVVTAMQAVAVGLDELLSKLDGIISDHNADILAAASIMLGNLAGSSALFAGLVSQHGDIISLQDLLTKLRDQIADVKTKAVASAKDALAALRSLSDLNGVKAAAAAGVGPPGLDPPQLVWEYWNGTAWTDLSASGNGKDFAGVDDETVAFTVPSDRGIL